MKCKTCGKDLEPSQCYSHVLMGGTYCKAHLFEAVAKWKKEEKKLPGIHMTGCCDYEKMYISFKQLGYSKDGWEHLTKEERDVIICDHLMIEWGWSYMVVDGEER